MSNVEAIWLTTPIWLIALIVYIGMILASLIGWRLHRQSLEKDKERATSEEGYVVSGVMGLLALLIGFTFAMAVDRFDSRRQMVIEEANAIGTAYLRTQMLAEPHRTRISDILTRYTENRLALSLVEINEGQPALLEKSDQLSALLWSATVSAFPTIRELPFSAPYVASINQLIDMDAARQQVRRTHVPMEVLLLLLVYLFMAAAVLGYALLGRQGRITASLLLLLYGSSLVLVIDLDRPNRGGIQESQRPMELLLASMRDHPAGSYDEFFDQATEYGGSRP